MTEALKSFLIRLGYEQPEAERCENLLRAFVDEIYERLDEPPYFGIDDNDGLAEVFEALTIELLGDPPRSAA
jgi:hypothetical protein